MLVEGLDACRNGHGPAVGQTPNSTSTLPQEGPADAACAPLSVAGLFLFLWLGWREEFAREKERFAEKDLRRVLRKICGACRDERG
jgi:hypothetical protein